MKTKLALTVLRTAGRALPLTAALGLLLLPATVAAQTLIFSDSFETADASNWSATEPPSVFGCNCYFSGDCNSGQFCDWGVLNLEDNCTWRLPKPEGTPGTGCDVAYVGPWTGGICDGTCVATESGSRQGWFRPELTIEGVGLWSEAVLRPAANGGGPVDPELAAAAKALPMGPTDSVLLGRQVASLLSEAADFGFYDYFCHWEAGDPSNQYVVDLSAEPCRLAAGRLAVRALLAEIELPGSGAPVVAEIPLHCPGQELGFGNNCPAGPGALDCLARRVEDAGRFLTTRGSVPPTRSDPQALSLEALLGL